MDSFFSIGKPQKSFFFSGPLATKKKKALVAWQQKNYFFCGLPYKFDKRCTYIILVYDEQKNVYLGHFVVINVCFYNVHKCNFPDKIENKSTHAYADPFVLSIKLKYIGKP